MNKSDEVARRMQEAGAPQALIDQIAAKDSGMPDVQPANLITTVLFFSCATQWNYAGMAGTRTGLNYQSVDVRAAKMPDFQALDLDEQNSVWEGLQVMESAALSVWREQSAD